MRGGNAGNGAQHAVQVSTACEYWQVLFNARPLTLLCGEVYIADYSIAKVSWKPRTLESSQL